tara:strand:+ start:487 stop:708 length:222 start_codon:yes stop_codon:yes gene_type:complete
MRLDSMDDDVFEDFAYFNKMAIGTFFAASTVFVGLRYIQVYPKLTPGSQQSYITRGILTLASVVAAGIVTATA